MSRFNTDGELKWYTNESADPKSFKLSNVINIEAHDLPDRDGYRAPNEMSATIAKRISSSCRHSAIKLTLKQKEGTGEMNKAIFLCAEVCCCPPRSWLLPLPTTIHSFLPSL